MVDEESAEQRADHGRETEHPAEESLIAPALARWDEVADDRNADDDETAAADSLKRAKENELQHALGDAAQHGAHEKDRNRHLQNQFAAVQIAQFPVERTNHGAGQEIRGDHPGQVGEAAEIAHDRGQRGRDDGLVEGGQEERQEQRAEHRRERRLRGARCSLRRVHPLLCAASSFFM